LWFPVQIFESGKNFFPPSNSKTPSPIKWTNQLLESAEKLLAGQLRYYAFHWKKVGKPPNWFLNPFNGEIFLFPQKHWTQLPDFNSTVGDIKNIWEASRFNWTIILAMAYSATQSEKYLSTLNNWCEDWAVKNPLNIGPNWKCGQEASIRIFNLVLVSVILKQDKEPTTSLTDFIYAHLKRIDSNLLYAMAQDNNHGISEAAALFIGGTWLHTANQKKYTSASAFSKKGRKWLENRVKRLICNDGSFSQHSIVYHRMVLDILSLVEFLCKHWHLPRFTPVYYSKIKSAIYWYSTFIDPVSGNSPNLGASDGTMLFDFGYRDYRDFRSS